MTDLDCGNCANNHLECADVPIECVGYVRRIGRNTTDHDMASLWSEVDKATRPPPDPRDATVAKLRAEVAELRGALGDTLPMATAHAQYLLDTIHAPTGKRAFETVDRARAALARKS